MAKKYFFYNCCLEWQQLRTGEDGCLAASEVLQKICYADFQRQGQILKNPKTDYCHKYAKPPQDGMFLMKVAKPASQTNIEVFIDTRLFPNFIWIEKIEGRLEECLEVGKELEYLLNQAAYKYGWGAKLVENQLNEVHDAELFVSALAFLNINFVFPSLGYLNYQDSSGNQFVGTQNNYYYGDANQGKAEQQYPENESSVDEAEKPIGLSESKMCEVCEKTLGEGLWWADASWGIAYQIFRQKGYEGGIDQFVEDVKGWPWKRPFPKKCNKFSVGDPVRRGAITWPLGKWKEKGANNREIVLGERIMELLET